MPYFRCGRCGLRVYSAAIASKCPECATQLEPGDRLFERSQRAFPLLAKSRPSERVPGASIRGL
jgi:hypothetical protein